MNISVLHEWRLPGCGAGCLPRRHDPADHEAYGARASEASAVRTGPLAIDRTTATVRVAGATVALSATEWRMLDALAARPGQVVTHEAMAERLFGRGWALLRRSEILHNLNAHRTRLRARLGPDAAALVVTVRDVGVRLEMAPPTDPLADAIERANAALDWIEARQGPLPADGYARIETAVAVVRALRRGGAS